MHRSVVVCFSLALAASACGGQAPGAVQTSPSGTTAKTMQTAPFELVGQGWVRVDAKISGAGPSARTESIRMMFDTGGGITLLSKKLCDRIGCVPDGTFTGKRMSGQDITVPMAKVASLEIAGHTIANARVAVLDTTTLVSPALGIEGVAALDLFRDQPFTIDYGAKRFVVEDETSLAARRAAGSSVRVRVDHDGPSTVVFLPLELSPQTKPLEMEVDNGSLHLILDDRYMTTLGIDAKDVERVEGHDETDNPYVRSYAHLPKAANVVGTANVSVPSGATVMFQRIIHDGLVGQQFLSARPTTFDVARSTLIFSPMN